MAKRKTAAKGEALASLKYGEAKERLEAILEELESNEVDIDDLADRITEARDLIRVLNDKLTRTKGEVEKVMADFAAEAPGDGETAGGSPDGGAGERGEAADPSDVPF